MSKRTISTAFYDVMFGQQQCAPDLQPLEDQILGNIRSVLNDREKLSKNIPPLPALSMQLLKLAKEPHADFAKLADIIEQDPSLSARVLRVANSPAYFRGSNPVTSLQKATALIGMAGINNIANTIVMEKFRPTSPIYYKMFGRLIWEHSIHTAFVCKDLAEASKLDGTSAYFLGLIHDLGKIVIFNCLCDALSSDFGSEAPGSMIFKSLMSEMSVDISTCIAQEWELPDEFVQALMQQGMGKFTDLGLALYKANLLTELYLLNSREQVTEEQVQKIIGKLYIEPQYQSSFFERAPDMVAGV